MNPFLTQLMIFLHCCIGDFPFKFLGIPIGANNQRCYTEPGFSFLWILREEIFLIGFLHLLVINWETEMKSIFGRINGWGISFEKLFSKALSDCNEQECFCCRYEGLEWGLLGLDIELEEDIVCLGGGVVI